MSKLDIHVGGTFADTKRRVLDAAARAERGEAIAAENHVTFESWAALTSVMTEKRFELLRHLHRHPEASTACGPSTTRSGQGSRSDDRNGRR